MFRIIKLNSILSTVHTIIESNVGDFSCKVIYIYQYLFALYLCNLCYNEKSLK